MKIKVLHIVGGPSSNGAYKGANILHLSLLNLGVNSKLLNDSPSKLKKNNIIYINDSFFKRLLNKIFIIIEKILKSFFLHSPRSTFTLGFFGFDITKLRDYKDADIIHIHWLSQGFIKFRYISKINKPIVWTMRDMWPFTGGSHYTMDFEKYEKGYLSKMIKNLKKKIYNKNIKFIAISNWLKNKAEKSDVLKDHEIQTIYNNIQLNDFNMISKEKARSILKISTNKQIILYGAQNPQSKRKGWEVFVESLKKIDKSKYLLCIFGKFWSQKTLDEIGIEYMNFGFINDNKKLNAIYSSADIFIASSIQEAFGKTWAEAMACGTPVVCFKNTSASEIIDHKQDGFIVEEADSQKLKEGIDWLCEEVKKKKFDNNLRNKIFNFDANLIAKKYIDVYQKVLTYK